MEYKALATFCNTGNINTQDGRITAIDIMFSIQAIDESFRLDH
jgi:hypothetical protein